MEHSWHTYDTGLKTSADNAVSIVPLTKSFFPEWQRQQSEATQLFIDAQEFKAKEGEYLIIPSSTGLIKQIIFGLGDKPDAVFWAWGKLPKSLPQSFEYEVDTQHDPSLMLNLRSIAYAWALGCYTYKGHKTTCELEGCGFTSLVIDDTIAHAITPLIKATYWIRDMINEAPNIMTPLELSNQASLLKETFGANVTVITDNASLESDYPLVYTVGKASSNDPCVIDVTWGQPHHPLITLVGKGVTFDTGGLNIKPFEYMKLMRKDMGGAAHVLGLGAIIMSLNLPLRLRLLIGAAENAVSGNAFKPSDVIKSRKGLFIELGHTDAEGRLLLADMLYEACQPQEDKPSLLIDFSTLTGAARVALGELLPAVFSNDSTLGHELQTLGLACHDPVWQLPLWHKYRDGLNSKNADLSSIGKSNYGDAIYAALFLNEFVDKDIPWLHLDFMGWNNTSKSARPEGGEALCLRAVIQLLSKKFNLGLPSV